MDPTIDFVKQWALPHWPFFAAAIIFGYVGVVLKKLVTPELAKANRFAWWFRATLPLHPVIAGLIAGATNLLPTSLGATGRAGSALYYGLAGAASSWVYAGFQHFVEKWRQRQNDADGKKDA